MLIVMANKMLSEFQFHLVPTRKRRRESWGETERDREKEKEGVSEILNRDLFAELFPTDV